MKGWQEALRARYHPMIPPETAASLAYRFPNHVAFTPKMFINEKWRSSSYDFALKYPIVYEAVILEVDSNWEGGPGGPGEYEMAMLVLIKNTFRSQRAKDNNLTASLKKGEKVWITYVEFPNHTLFTDDFYAYPHHKWFDRIMQPGTAIHFSAFREGGNSLGTRKLIYLKKINREYK